MSSWADKRPHGRNIVRNVKIHHEGRYWDAYRLMSNDDTRQFNKLLCDHCTHLIGFNGKRNSKMCNYCEDEGHCRLCTPFECIPNGFFQQKGYRPADTERMQQQIEEFVDRLLEGKR